MPGDHWISVSQYDATWTRCETDGIHLLSIVLDGRSWEDFSGVRVIIVVRERGYRDEGNLVIAALDDPLLLEDHGFYTHPKLDCGYPYTRLFRQHRLHDRICVAQTSRKGDGNVPLPLLTIALELTSFGEGPYHDIQMFSASTKIGWINLPQAAKIIYDNIFSCSQERSSLFTVLDISHLEFPDDDENNYTWNKRVMNSICNALAIRVIPFDKRRRRVAPYLPKETISRIVRFAMDSSRHYEITGWEASALLRYSLVAKPWLHVLELYFARIGNSTHCPSFLEDRKAKSLARNIIKNPHLVHNFKDLDAFLFYGIRPKRLLNHLGSVIFSAAPSLQYIRLPHRLLETSLQDLQKLKQVETLSVRLFCDSGTAVFPKARVSMHDIQRSIMHWKKLRNIELLCWDFSDEYGMKKLPSTHWLNTGKIPKKCVITLRASYNLTHLDLGLSTLTGTQLLHFVSGPRPQLQDFSLVQIEGLHNDDLYEFFAITHKTLQSIKIGGCMIHPPRPGEPYALEAHISRMSSLTYASIQGDIATPRLFKRPSGIERWSRLEVLDPFPDFLSDCKLVELCMRESHWKQITIRIKKGDLYEQMRDSIQKASTYASKHNIFFECDSEPGGECPMEEQIVTDTCTSDDEEF